MSIGGQKQEDRIEKAAMELENEVKEEKGIKRVIGKSIVKCATLNCDNEFNVPHGSVKFYCSKKCRLIGRGSKKGKLRAAKLV